ncbi:hypothetical protein FRC04_004019 [Tulasnella sp. 424]|nr:hypothetical protein FRC04_004019 [Tulasnella sp. 424]
MDRYFSTSSPEYKAHAHVADYVFWDANITAKDIGLCAAYASLQRFVKGEDLYIPPRNVTELQAVLRNYSDHVVNSLCSQVVSRVALRNSNGWAVDMLTLNPRSPSLQLARAQSASSLADVLSKDGNLERLVALHSAPQAEVLVSPLHHLVEEDDYAFGSGAATPRQIRSN